MECQSFWLAIIDFELLIFWNALLKILLEGLEKENSNGNGKWKYGGTERQSLVLLEFYWVKLSKAVLDTDFFYTTLYHI